MVEPEDPLPPAATAGVPEPTEPKEQAASVPPEGDATKDETKSEEDKTSEV